MKYDIHHHHHFPFAERMATMACLANPWAVFFAALCDGFAMRQRDALERRGARPTSNAEEDRHDKP